MERNLVFPVLVFLVSVFVLSSAQISPASADFIVGVSPPIVDIGEVERGTSKIVRFNIVTPSEDTILVYVEKAPAGLDFFAAKDERRYQFSEEDVLPWINFVDNPVELSSSDKPKDVDIGDRGLREIRFVLNVPETAEPGYHVFNVIPTPVLPDEVISGAGARVVSVSVVSFIFKVPGEARRDGVILDVTPGEYVGGSLQVNTFFTNTGTVSVSANAVQDFERGEVRINDVSSGLVVVKPGETATLTSQLSPGDSAPGEYNVETSVFFGTGSATKSSSFFVAEPPPEPEMRPVATDEEGLPLYLIIIIVVAIVIAAVAIYLWRF